MYRKEVGMDEFELVRHMRIDFNLIPIKGCVIYPIGLERQIFLRVKRLLVGEDDENLDVDVKICPGKSPFWVTLRKFDKEGYDKQLRDGDPGYIVIRGRGRGRGGGGVGGFGFVDSYPGDDWDHKFDNARQSLIHEVNCIFYDTKSQLLITHLHPSQDARLFINLLSSSSSTQLPPTLLLQGLPPYWFRPAYQPSLENFFNSLAKIRDLDMSGNNVSIQFKNYKECYKALKKLCSHSLKKNGEKCVVDYELTLEDDCLVSNAFDEVLAYKYNGYKAYNQSATAQALNNRVAMLEKEFNLVKVITENSKDLKGSSEARALNHRAAMLEKRLDIVKSVMEEVGAGYNESASTQALRNRVSMLNKELSTMKVVLEDASIDRIQALEIRVAMLEKELKTMKDGMTSIKKKDVIKESAVGYNKSPMDPALKRCKRLRRE